MSTVLTNAKRNELVQKLVCHAMKDKQEAKNAEVKQLSDMIFRLFVSEEIEVMSKHEEMKRFISFSDSPRVWVPGIGRINLSLGRAAPHMAHRNYDCSDLSKEDSKKVEKLATRLYKIKEDYEQEVRTLQAELNGTLKGFNSIKKLRAAMPEIEPFLPADTLESSKTGTALVPIEAVEKTRALLKTLAKNIKAEEPKAATAQAEVVE